MSQSLTKAVLVSIMMLGWAVCVHADSPPAWDRQEAQKYGWIYDDFDAAVEKSTESGKPILSVLRCPP